VFQTLKQTVSNLLYRESGGLKNDSDRRADFGTHRSPPRKPPCENGVRAAGNCIQRALSMQKSIGAPAGVFPIPLL
jgi:hypothetical protein